MSSAFWSCWVLSLTSELTHNLPEPSATQSSLRPSEDSAWSRSASIDYVTVLEFNLDFRLYTVTRETVPNYRTYFFLWSSMIELFLIGSWGSSEDARTINSCMLNRFSHVCLFVTPWTVACQAPLSMGFSRQEYWGGLPCPPPGDLPDPGIETMSLKSPALAGGFFTTELPGKPTDRTCWCMQIFIVWATREALRILKWVANLFSRRSS